MRLTITSILLFSFFAAQCQQADLIQFNIKRSQITKGGMTVLGGWAIGNIGTGALLMSGASGSDKYFHQMNVAWNAVNLGIAALGYAGAMREMKAKKGTDNYRTVLQQKKIENTLLLNAGLGLAYISTGLYLKEKSKNESDNPEMLKGFGDSVMLQGAFLFVFDVVLFFRHSKHAKALEPILTKLHFTGDQLGITWTF